MNDINLPPDADDLSRHAPALLALKGTETGFIVPALYFEELSELVIAKTSIPEEGGLVVPENYFEELPAIVEARTAIPSEDGLVLPENYFEELPSVIEAKTSFDFAQDDTDPAVGLIVPENYFETLGTQLESQIALENVLPPFAQDDNAIPSGYFDQLESELHVHIALDNVKQDEGFVVPGNYFEKFYDRITSASLVDFAQPDNSSQEDPNIPDGYFESLHDKVVSRLENEAGTGKKEERGRVIVFAQWKKYVAVTAVAASVALLIAFAWTFTGTEENGNGGLADASGTKNLVPENYVKKDPLPVIDTTPALNVVVPEGIAREIPKNPQPVKPPQQDEVIMNDDEIIAQSDLMDETMVMEFVMENNVIEPTEEVLDPAMMEYLMNDNTGFDIFEPADKKKK